MRPIAVDPGRLQSPSLARRLACFVYEGVLLFGVLMVAGLIYGVITQQRHALTGSAGLQAYLALVLAAYFVYFWSRTGQTLAMLTWHIRLVTVDGDRVAPLRALCRYLLAWLWFLPALAAIRVGGLHGVPLTLGALTAGVLVYAAMSRLHPGRQYLHDAICQTRLVNWRSPDRKEPTSA